MVLIVIDPHLFILPILARQKEILINEEFQYRGVGTTPASPAMAGPIFELLRGVVIIKMSTLTQRALATIMAQ